MGRAAVVVTVLAVLLTLAGANALAQPQPYPGKDQPPRERPMSPAKQEDPDRMRGAQVPVRPVQERMSPEDRRQLRRDIDQHGRELYRDRNH